MFTPARGFVAPAFFFKKGGDGVVSRFWTSVAVLTFAISMASGASAQGTATTASTTIANSAGIAVTGEVIFQDIDLGPQAPIAPVVASSESSASVRVVSDDAMSLAMPDSFELTREGGVEKLTVVLMKNGSYEALEHLRTVVVNGDALSIDISGAIRVDASELAPGEYQGLLVVVAQYN